MRFTGRQSRLWFPNRARHFLLGRVVTGLSLFVALGVIAPAGWAQSPVSLGVGAGMTVPRDDLESTTDRGYHGLVTLRVGFPLVPVHLRADVMHGQLAAASSAASDLQITSATVNAGYDVIPLAVVSVYVIGGVGYYWTKLDAADAERVRNGGWNAGAGVRLSLGPLRLFAEARYHTINVESGDAHVVPVTVGVMF